jgi:hypothetical protein
MYLNNLRKEKNNLSEFEFFCGLPLVYIITYPERSIINRCSYGLPNIWKGVEEKVFLSYFTTAIIGIVTFFTHVKKKSPV